MTLTDTAIHILKKILLVSALTAITGAAMSCSDRRDAGSSDVLASVDTSVLTRADLARELPSGLSSDDSIRYATAYIRDWVDKHLLSDIASGEIDMSRIDRLVNDYRNRLIALEYRRLMFETHVQTDFAEDSLRNYYVRHNREFVLERPMLQGIYLKVPDDAPNLTLIKRLYRSSRQEDIDRLEKEVLSSAVHYDYFRDKWVDWEQIESRIPYDFSDKPEDFLRGRTHFETEAGGFVYLLEIRDILPAGATMPFDNARILIAERLTNIRRVEYDGILINELYRDALEKGRLKINVSLER